MACSHKSLQTALINKFLDSNTNTYTNINKNTNTNMNTNRIELNSIMVGRHKKLSFTMSSELNLSIHVGAAAPTRFFCRAEIFKGCFVQIYSNQGVSCRNIGQTPVRATLCCAAEFFGSDQTKLDCIRLQRKMANGSGGPVTKEYEQK